jgi:hypothetical protein
VNEWVCVGVATPTSASGTYASGLTKPNRQKRCLSQERERSHDSKRGGLVILPPISPPRSRARAGVSAAPSLEELTMRACSDETVRPLSRISPDGPVTASYARSSTGDDHMEATTLKSICADLKIDPRVAREKLRAAIREPKKYPNLAKAHKPRQPWAWAKGSPADKEARAALSA